MKTVEETCRLAKENVAYPSLLSSEDKNKMLRVIADALVAGADKILGANETDIAAGKDLPPHMIDRLRLTRARIDGIADGIRTLIELPDPIGVVTESWTNHAGLHISRVTVPIGVVGIIYEARPNVTCDVVGICIKTGNAVVLRGSKDAYTTNSAIVDVIREALENNGFKSGFIQLIEDTTREGSEKLMRMDEYLDVLIPRGSASLIQTVKKIPPFP